ncbi:MAG: hypothetical protein LBG80_08850 [Bacteroidales bacterium]|jgi:hypothetical protein|nr:hypothetical protein [Bacteroidales bacterium]
MAFELYKRMYFVTEKSVRNRGENPQLLVSSTRSDSYACFLSDKFFSLFSYITHTYCENSLHSDEAGRSCKDNTNEVEPRPNRKYEGMEAGKYKNEKNEKKELFSLCTLTGDRFTRSLGHCKPTGDRFTRSLRHCKPTGDRFTRSLGHCKPTGDQFTRSLGHCKPTRDWFTRSLGHCKPTRDWFTRSLGHCTSTRDFFTFTSIATSTFTSTEEKEKNVCKMIENNKEKNQKKK